MSKGYWAATKGSSKEMEGSHMVKHMQQCHEGGEPEFIMRVVEFHKSVSSRQMRRGEKGVFLTPGLNSIDVIYYT